jgi:nucleotide-binding universal stress UspA family protein
VRIKPKNISVEQEEQMIKRILVPLDGSKLAEVVLPYVEEFALKLGAEVFMISVTNSIQGYWPFEDAGQPDTVRLVPQGVCTREDHAAMYLSSAAKALEEKGIKVTKDVICGKTVQEIIFYANDNKIDLMVISTHGRTGLRKITHGSITAKLIKLARVPLTIIRPMK